MDSIIDFIFSNFLILFIVVGGLAKLVGGDTKKNESDTKTRQPAQTRQQSQGRATNRTHSMSKQESSESMASVSIEEQQQKQLERLAGKVATHTAKGYDDLTEQSYSSNSHHAFLKSDQNNKKEFTNNKKEVKKRLNKKINRSGLIDSVIMAEVLGPPRARKPYKSVISERNN